MRLTALLLGILCFYGVCVFSAPLEVRKLKGIVGERVSFPAAVKTFGYLIKDRENIAKIDNFLKHYNTSKSPKDRVQWNSSTGFFSIADLKMEDSGEYRVQSNDGKKVETIYQLSVYNPVSTPQVSSRNKMKPTCSVLCSVENGREVTLSWQREGKTLSHTSSPDLNTPLSLPLEIEEYSSTYSCVAANPASNKTVTVRPEEHCFGPVSTPQVSSRNKMKPTCSVLCSVENGREVTLSWQREGETLSNTSSPDLNTPLSLPLEIEEYSSTYSCVAANPASEERSFFSISELCGEEDTHPASSIPLIAGIGAAVLLIITVLGTVIYLERKKTTGSGGDSADVYTNANYRHRQKQKATACSVTEVTYSLYKTLSYNPSDSRLQHYS
ncbi:hypothetical protein MATL_G00220740 [Megalops atlanticus]|uniref:Ig-like domain-containing protein n=1 Tax=Megalops atlanticus TaxID=7932 RepID=A0A9D3PH63_MEGAT|nr:hypothetical protein MATL_G00220740 [Megalops atlanticus]